MRILVLGAGGIGGYFGGRLAQSGADVTFLVRAARAALLKRDGLRLESPRGDATLQIETVTEDEAVPTADLVLLSCKAYDLDGAMEAIAPAVGARTAILPLLNGLAHLDRLDARFGAERVLGGLAHISVTLEPDGAIRQLLPLQRLTFGARDEAQHALAEAAAACLAPASFEVRRSPDVLRDMWEKFAFITAAAGITCLMRASVGSIMNADDGERLTRALLAECEAVAAASGFASSGKASTWAVSFLTQTGSTFTASMMRDLEAGGRVEADHLQGDMIRRGNALGVGTDLLRVAYCALQSYQDRRRAEIG